MLANRRPRPKCHAFLLGLVYIALPWLVLPEVSHAQCAPRAFSTEENKVARAYLAYYGRAPDAGGLDYWSARLANEGGSLDAIIEAFGVSEEFNNRFGNLSDEDLVNNLYQQQFGRDAETAGLDFYVGELRAGRMSLQTISLNIIDGAQNNDATVIANRLAVSQQYVTLAEANGKELSPGAIFSMLDGIVDAPTSAEACTALDDAYEIEESLVRLGIDNRETKRRNASGGNLPDDYAPLGSRRTLDKSSELFTGGLRLLGDTDTSNVLDYQPDADPSSGTIEKQTGFTTTPAWRSSPYNAAAPGDLDGDGFDEVVLLWWDPVTSAVAISLVDDASEGFNATEARNLLTATPSALAAITGDFDGDTRDEVVLGVVDSAAGVIELYVLEGNKQDGFSATGPSSTHAATRSPSTLGIELAAGRLDRDRALELVVVVNETQGGGQNGSPGSGVSYYHLYDDVTASLAERVSERVFGFADGQTYDGLTAAPALGDLDGDNLDELVIAAITGAFPTNCDPITTVQLALDDLDAGTVSLGTSIQTLRIPNCETSGNNGWTSHLWADGLDMDKDPYSEVHVNGVVYDDFVNTEPFTRKVVSVGDDDEEVQVPARNIFAEQGNNQRLRTTWRNTSISVGDVSADGFDDIIVYMPGRVRLRQVSDGRVTYWETGYAVTAWGIDPITGAWGQRWYQELEERHQDEDEHGPPVALAANMDADSTVLRFSRGSHRIVFTEPVILAALAAPPCHGDGSQVTDVCQTSWGTGSSQGVNASTAHEITARHHFGVNASLSLPVIGDVGAELEQTVGRSVAAEASLGYEITKTITYNTGAMEDTVVATVIPYDQYSYEILSHPIYPDLVGTDVVISLPRSPRTIQVERAFFNEALTDSSPGVGNDVFSHTIGDISSYPSRNQMRTAVTNSGAASIGPVDVGASSGSTSVEISEATTSGFTESVTVSYEASVKTTAGAVMSGFSVGTSSTASLGVTVGSQVTFSGTVGDMPPASFDLDKAYSYGLFAYKQRLPGSDRDFQVINYWVE